MSIACGHSLRSAAVGAAVLLPAAAEFNFSFNGREIDPQKLSYLVLDMFMELEYFFERDTYYGVDGQNIMDAVIKKEKMVFFGSWQTIRPK